MAREKVNKINIKSKTVKPYISAVGRRREAIARVRLYPTNVKVDGVEKGEINVNGKAIQDYFRFKAFAPVYNKFLVTTGASGKYTFTVRVVGGGLEGQMDAMILGMARALDKMDRDAIHKVLRDNGYLTRDPRTRERRKVGNAGKARRKKSSPKR